MYNFRALSVADRADFRALRETALAASPDDFMMTLEEERAVPHLFIESALEQPADRNVFLGAFTSDAVQLIAIAGLITPEFLKTRHIGRVTSLFVHPDHRRRGIARRLLADLFHCADRAALRSVRLEVVADNRDAIALYTSLGFVTLRPRARRLSLC